jgi:Xaa-Pro aminopeptidase
MTATLMAARPDWTERDLAGAGAAALWRRGIHPALTLVGGARRLPLYRHATPTAELLGDRAMLVFCGRRHGLYANLTRFVSFREPTAEEQAHLSQVARVEQAAWAASRPGQTVGAAYAAIVRAYAAEGHAGAERGLHQGGTTGYLSREVLGRPAEPTEIETATALAWNPSLPGTKLEDTILVSHAGAEILTADPLWPTFSVNGHARPAILVRP